MNMSELIKLDGKFYCFKCNNSVVNLYQHLKQDHSIPVDEYLEWVYNKKIEIKVCRSKQ